MRVRVDPEKCQGHTLCAMKAPGLFELSEVDGHSTAVTDEVAAGDEAAALDAVHSCPEQAIIVSLPASTKATTMTARNLDEPARKAGRYHFDRHAPDYRDHFEEITEELHSTCPVAWSDTYGGHWVVSGHEEVFEIARRADVLSNDRDVTGERRGYQAILQIREHPRPGLIDALIHATVNGKPRAISRSPARSPC
jgi:ferredoxin